METLALVLLAQEELRSESENSLTTSTTTTNKKSNSSESFEDNDIPFFIARILANFSLLDPSRQLFLFPTSLLPSLVKLSHVKFQFSPASSTTSVSDHLVQFSAVHSPCLRKLAAQTIANVSLHSSCCVQLLGSNVSAVLSNSILTILEPVMTAYRNNTLESFKLQISSYLERYAELLRCLIHAVANIAQVGRDERAFLNLVEPLSLLFTVLDNNTHVLATLAMAVAVFCSDHVLVQAFARENTIQRATAQRARLTSLAPMFPLAATAVLHIDRALSPMVNYRSKGISLEQLEELFNNGSFEPVSSNSYESNNDNNHDHDETQCPICMETAALGDKFIRLPNCKHHFHQGCLSVWLEAHTACPMCRTSVISQN